MINIPNTNSGHGHVWERPDGVKARCGGPKLCKECQTDKGFVETLKQFPLANIFPEKIAEILWRLFDMGYRDREIELSVMSDKERQGACFLCAKAKSDGVLTTMELRISRDDYNRANGEKHIADLEQALTDARYWLGVAAGEYSIPEELTKRIDALIGRDRVMEKARLAQEFSITINGVKWTTHDRHITYDDLVRIAGMSGTPTVVYERDGELKRCGVFTPGHTIMIEEGMIFDLAHTNNA